MKGAGNSKGIRIPLSVAVITKNEERDLPACLESVRFADDLVVVDSGSSDGTLAAAKKYDCRIFEKKWEGYARQKQFAVDRAERQWVLILDADERVTPGLREEITGKIQDPAVSGYYIPRKNFFLGKWMRRSGWWPDYTLRLFQKEKAHIELREVHEKVSVQGAVEYLSHPIEHYTYNTLSEYIEKMENYSTLAAREIRKKGASHRTVLSMVLNPGVAFIRMFIIRQGFRDGVRGLILAILYSFYTFLKYAKAWEKKSV